MLFCTEIGAESYFFLIKMFEVIFNFHTILFRFAHKKRLFSFLLIFRICFHWLRSFLLLFYENGKKTCANFFVSFLIFWDIFHFCGSPCFKQKKNFFFKNGKLLIFGNFFWFCFARPLTHTHAYTPSNMRTQAKTFTQRRTTGQNTKLQKFCAISKSKKKSHFLSNSNLE